MRKPAIGFVLACVFLDALGIGLIVPVLPRLIGSLADTRDLQTSWYGAIMVSYGLMQFFFAPILGALSDRIGRRPVLLTGILGLSIMMIVPAVSQSLPFILLSRLVGGMMSSNIVVAQAYIADVTPSHQRIASFGKIGAIFGIAFVLGPAVSQAPSAPSTSSTASSSFPRASGSGRRLRSPSDASTRSPPSGAWQATSVFARCSSSSHSSRLHRA